MATVVVKKGRANPLWHGHPWLFSGSVAEVRGAAEPGDVVEVHDTEGRFIGRGVYNPRSQLRVRMLTLRDEPVDAAFVRRRVDEAIVLRRRLGLPSEETSAYRLINSEGDGLPGVVVDVYGDVLGVQWSALGAKRLEAPLLDALEAALAPRAIVETAQAGMAKLEGFHPETRVVRGEKVDVVTCRENGLHLEVEPLAGQKTGMFLDQRENRRKAGRLAAGARVLDVYTYAGGFALSARRGGAREITCVDSSARALERVRRHAALNQLDGIEVVEADAFRFLETARPHAYDLVVLDPPKFARAQKDLPAALKGYQRLNTLGLNACAENAILVTCTCSQLVDQAAFERVLAAAARDAGRRVQVLEVASQGPDHPVPPAFPEGRYLTVLYCRVA